MFSQSKLIYLKMSSEVYNTKLDSYDWRLQAVTTLKWDQRWWKDGDVITVIWQFPMSNSSIWFELPNMSAVFLDFSNQLFKKTDWYFVFRNFEKRKGYGYAPKNFDELMGVLQCRIWNVIYSFLALESFMNDSIPKEYIFQERVKGSIKYRDQKFIQEQLPIGRKFTEVLPQIYWISAIEDKIISDFEKLKELRDRLTHLKEVDKISSWPDDLDIWKILFDKAFQNHALNTKNIIWYFLQNVEEGKLPRWFRKINLN